MGNSFAEGKNSPRICDRCGMRGMPDQMVFGYQTVHYSWQEEPTQEYLVVHRECRDRIVKRRILRNDPEAIMDPRPDRVEPYDGPNGYEPELNPL